MLPRDHGTPFERETTSDIAHCLSYRRGVEFSCPLPPPSHPARGSWCTLAAAPAQSTVPSQSATILPSQAQRRVGGGQVGHKATSRCGVARAPLSARCVLANGAQRAFACADQEGLPEPVLTSSFTPTSLSSPARQRRAADVGNGESRRARMARHMSLRVRACTPEKGLPTEPVVKFAVRSARGRSEFLSLAAARRAEAPVNFNAHNGAFSSQENAGTKRPRQSTCETEDFLFNRRNVVCC